MTYDMNVTNKSSTTKHGFQ